MAAYIGTRPAARNHQLPKPHFEALCAGLGDADAVRELWSTQRSRRLLLINAVVKAAGGAPDALGPLPPAAEAWDVLIAAEKAKPAEFTDILLHPQVGSWAAYVLRRHRRRATSDAPLWIDFGVLHSLALTAAAQVGLPWHTRVPARSGRVMLPRLGMATFPADDDEPWSYAEAETADGRIRLTRAGHALLIPTPEASPRLESAQTQNQSADSTSPAWWPLRKLHVGDTPGPRLLVSLNDIDPYRDLAEPVPPDRLDEADAATWSNRLAEAWHLLRRDHHDAAEAMSEGVVSLVALPPGDGTETRSASTGEAFGSVLISPPFDGLTLAVSLVHEFQHIKLGGLMHLCRLAEDDDRRRYYAPWRDDPRPLGGLLQGAYAFAGIVAFWRRHRGPLEGRERHLADFEYAYSRLQVEDALRTLGSSNGLTSWGEHVVGSLTNRFRSWSDDELPPEIARAAGLMAVWHRATWRIHHMSPAETDVQDLATAWITGDVTRTATLAATIRPHSRLRWSQGMAKLVRHHLGAPADQTDAAWLIQLGLTEADAALVGEDFTTAQEAYIARIVRDPDDLNAWTGLGLAAESRGALIDAPELVRAVYIKLLDAGHAPEPAPLAAHVAKATAGLGV
jgi:HEXXH motif-containing protein